MGNPGNWVLMCQKVMNSDSVWTYPVISREMEHVTCSREMIHITCIALEASDDSTIT